MPPTEVSGQQQQQTPRRAAAGEQEQQQQLACPRCDSTNTKFCYYNNYNFSQPRHFCKSCRRYWTHGGTLRDIPVGGGTRKNAKRSRLAPSPDAAAAKLGPPPPPSFTSLLASSSPAPGFLGFGLGLGLDDVGFGLARGLWASFPAGDPLSPPATRIGIAHSAPWHFDSAAATAGDFSSWAEPGISTPSTGFK